MKKQYQISLEEYLMEWIAAFCGAQDKNLSIICEAFSCEIIVRDNVCKVLCEEETEFIHVQHVLQAAFEMLEHLNEIQPRDIQYIVRLEKIDRLSDLSLTYQKPIGKTVNGKLIYPKTIGQRNLFRCMCKSEIVFASGVAGTGKTYLAVVYAATLLKKGEIRKIILTRPAVEAGENLGFLPGDLKEKVDPYLRPLYDALYDVLGKEQVEKLLEKEIIEIAPLAYMRGRTLDNAFIILDEAQNTTRAQMKMFLTRMGYHSRIVITGDVSQIDLIRKKDSGLVNAKAILDGIEGISFVELTSLDVVRHPLVQKIIECYEREEGTWQEYY